MPKLIINNLGIVFKKQDKLDLAQEYHQKALALKPDDASIYNNLPEQENKKRLWRQGDVLIQECDWFPSKVKRKKGTVLVHGEASGHTHRIADKRTARIYKSTLKEHEQNGTLFLDIFAEKAEIVHPEHHTIPLEKGLYHIWRQREFTIKGGFRMVAD